MELNDAIDFARVNTHSVLTTIRRNGRPQLSNVLHNVDVNGIVRISITADRAKYKNLVREPWAALHVSQPDFYGYVVLEARAELSPVAGAPDDATVDELVEYYRAAVGEHDDWDAFRASILIARTACCGCRSGRPGSPPGGSASVAHAGVRTYAPTYRACARIQGVPTRGSRSCTDFG
jgi:PPOX class probable F420-dependent enzyme